MNKTVKALVVDSDTLVSAVPEDAWIVYVADVDQYMAKDNKGRWATLKGYGGDKG